MSRENELRSTYVSHVIATNNSKLAMKDACVASLSDPDCRALAKLIRLSAKPHIS